MINVNQITSKLALMPDAALKQFAEMHKEDPYSFSLAIAESNRRKEIRSQVPAAQPQPKVADQELHAMTQLPEDVGIGALPVDMRMASGGIVAFDEGGDVYSNEGRNKVATFDDALNVEGIDDPRQRAFLKAIYSQESSSGKNTKTSNKGAIGGMQIIPSTFAAVADKDMDINKPLDNMRAGIRYASQGYDKAGGDPVLAGAYYYGGPGGMKKAAKGIEVSDSSNPKAPTTIGYGKSIAKKMFEFLPMGSAQAEEVPFSQSVGNEELVQPSSNYSNEGRNPPKSFLDSARENFQFLENQKPKSGVAYDPATFGKPEANAIQPLYPETMILGGPGRMAAVAKRFLNLKPAEETTAGLPAIAPKPTTEGSPLLIGRDLSAAEKQRMNISPRGPSYEVTPEASTMNALARQRLARQGAARNAAQSEEVPIVPSAAAQVARPTQPNVTKFSSALDVASAQNARSEFDANDPRRTDAKQVEDKDFAKDMPVEIQNLKDRYPKKEDLSKEDKKDIIAQAKEASPELKSRGLSDEDWLHLGFALMGGTSQYALTNLGQAGLSTLAAKAEREKQANQLAMYKAVHASGGETTKMIAALRAEDPTLSYSDAMTMALGAKTGADIKQQRADTANAAAYTAGKNKLESQYPSILRSAAGETGQKMTAAYNKELKALQEKFKIKSEQEVAPAALPLKVLNKQ